MYGQCIDCVYCRIKGKATLDWLTSMSKICKKRIEEADVREPVRDVIDEIRDQNVVCARHPVAVDLNGFYVYEGFCGCGEYEEYK